MSKDSQRFDYLNDPRRLVSPSACFQWLVDLSAHVRGCRMPALSRRCSSTHRCSVGGRRTSLEGGNRGIGRSGHGRPQGYGDLNHASVV